MVGAIIVFPVRVMAEWNRQPCKAFVSREWHWQNDLPGEINIRPSRSDFHDNSTLMLFMDGKRMNSYNEISKYEFVSFIVVSVLLFSQLCHMPTNPFANESKYHSDNSGDILPYLQYNLDNDSTDIVYMMEQNMYQYGTPSSVFGVCSTWRSGNEGHKDIAKFGYKQAFEKDMHIYASTLCQN